MENSRLKNSVINMSSGLFVYIISMVLQFINRIFFLQYLSIDYLGINGLFINLLSMLNIAELGIAGAMVYALYKPLNENNADEIKSLMYLYKKMYTFVGFFVLLIGFFVTPFLDIFINANDIGDVNNIYIYFIIYVLDAGISYFLSYKRSIIICSQQYYLLNGINLFKIILTNLFQIVILIVFHNYLLFLITKVIFTFLENITISMIANIKFPFLKEKAKLPDKTFMNSMKKNIVAMSMHKIGTVIVFGTDNLIISKFVSLSATGLYSNYTIIVNAITSIVGQFITAITASVGNLIAEKKDNDRMYIYQMFKNVYFINFCMYYIFSVGIYCCMNNLISIWIGKQYLLDNSVLLCVIFSFYSLGMRKTIMLFKDADGLFWKDRYKPIIEAASNLVLSIPLTIYFGIAGTVIGTIITNIFIAGIIEAYVAYKYLFKQKFKGYLYLQLKYLFLTTISLFFSRKIISPITIGGLEELIIKGIISLFFTIVIIIIIFFKKNEFKYCISIFRKMIKKYK